MGLATLDTFTTSGYVSHFQQVSATLTTFSYILLLLLLLATFMLLATFSPFTENGLGSNHKRQVSLMYL